MISIKNSLTLQDVLFPVTKPWKTEHIDVGDGHSLYVQQFGNRNGVPVLIVHGGPGGGIKAESGSVRQHDPSYFRIIAVDQRGCGASIPHVADDRKKAFYKNTPDKLVSDFEMIRQALDLRHWHVCGYSWGSCLSVYYASFYPQSIRSLTVGGIWMHTPQEIDWYINRMGLFFPEAEAELLKTLPRSTKRFDRLEKLYKAIMGKDQKIALRVAEAQGQFENVAVHFISDAEQKAEQQTEQGKKKKKSAAEKRHEKLDTIARGALEIYFMRQHPLPTEWYKSKDTKQALKQIKDFVIIQGRYDIVCPPTMAYELHNAHPHSKCTFVHYAGHRATPEFMQTMIKAHERLKRVKSE